MGNRQSSAQLNSHLTQISSQHSNLYISDSKTSTFQTQHIILVAGVGIIVALFILLVCSCVLNCYLCNKFKRENGIQSISKRSLRQSRPSPNLYVQPVMQSNPFIKEARESICSEV
uniref:Non-structural protein 1, peptide 1 n=1 Tax=Rotavirus B (isolate RVB/Rat/United States/IDIR/1984/G1P[X]) TaxID=28877 RepID=NSP1A_ROTGI|nr:RecName: Full=Non-structural protein 1, peptide 1; Short=NSP1 peptide 1; AltName: Full=NSP1-1 [IDIR agent]AAA60454.1 ORF 2 [Rotavirus A]